ELLGAHVLARRRLHERGAADEDRPRAAHDDRLVRHGGDVRAPGGARAHHGGDLRDAEGRQARLVEEDAAEVLPVREHPRLQGQEGAARVDQVEAGEPVLQRHLLRAQVLLHRQREVGAALDGGVVGDEDAVTTLDDPDPGHDPGRRRLAVVEVPGGERVQLEEGGARVDEAVDALAGSQLPARAVALERLLAASARDELGALAQLGHELLHPRSPCLEHAVADDPRAQDAHRARAYRSRRRAERRGEAGGGGRPPRRGFERVSDAPGHALRSRGPACRPFGGHERRAPDPRGRLARGRWSCRPAKGPSGRRSCRPFCDPARVDVQELLASRAGEDLETYARGINPQFVKILRTIGFDREWERTSGQYLYDADGRRYLDLLGGFGMFNVGRNNPRVRAALVQALELEVPNAVQLGVSPLPGLLAEALLARAPAGIGKVLFTSSGTEAVEAAIKLGRAAAGRPRVLSAEHGFHGLTLGSLSINGNPEFTARFGPLLPGCDLVAWNDLEAMERELARGDVALVVLEPVQGKGANLPAPGYLEGVQELCRRHGTLLCLDEVQTVFGRCGRFLALEHWGLQPDL